MKQLFVLIGILPSFHYWPQDAFFLKLINLFKIPHRTCPPTLQLPSTSLFCCNRSSGKAFKFHCIQLLKWLFVSMLFLFSAIILGVLLGVLVLLLLALRSRIAIAIQLIKESSKCVPSLSHSFLFVSCSLAESKQFLTLSKRKNYHINTGVGISYEHLLKPA